MVTKRYTKEEFEAFPTTQTNGESYRFLGNGVWHVFDAKDKEAYDAIVEKPVVLSAKEQRADEAIANLTAEIDALRERVAALEAAKESRRSKQAPTE